MKNNGFIVADISTYVNGFKQDLGADERYASFDYCYRYFKENDVAFLKKDFEKSCLVVGFYLASWGMLRGSSFLLQKSASYYRHLVEIIIKEKQKAENLWSIDVSDYKEKGEHIINFYKEIKNNFIHHDKDKNCPAHLTLATKILMGVFGVVPAYDQYFQLAMKKIAGIDCGFTSFNQKSLNRIQEFYEDNQKEIDDFAKATNVISFGTGQEIEGFCYPKAKIIDMYGFAKGLELDKQMKSNKNQKK